MSLLDSGGRGSYYSGRRRRRRTRRVLTALVVLLLAAAVAAGVWYQFFRDDAVQATRASGCPTTAASGPASTSASASASPSAEALPAASTITVTVLNTTDRDGLAKGVADALTTRGFLIGEVTNAPAGTTVPGAAEVRYGPGGELAARVVAAQIGDPSTVGQAAAPLPGGTVQVLLGVAFVEVNSPDVAAQLLSPSPTPSAAPTC